MKCVCVVCRSEMRPKKITQGSFIVELFLWCMMILPGVLYTVWRLTSKVKLCPICGSSKFVKAGTPAAQRLLA